MAVNDKFPAQKKNVTTFCVAMKEDQGQGIQIAVFERDNNSVIPAITLRPDQDGFAQGVFAILSPFGIDQTKFVSFPSTPGAQTSYHAIVGVVPDGQKMPENYKLVPLVGAYNMLTGNEAKIAAIGLCAHYKVQLTDRSQDRNLTKS